MYDRVPSGLLADVTVWDAKTKQSSHVPWTDRQGIVFAVAQRVMRGIDNYYGVGLTREDLGPGLRGTKYDVVALPGFWMDIDVAGEGHASKSLPSQEEAFGILETCPLEPTLIVHSGGGLHAYWLFEDALILQPGDHDRINNLSKSFQNTIIAAAKSRGFHCDQTGNIDRVLRLPGAPNFKTGTARPVEVIFSEGTRYDSRIVFALATPKLSTAPPQTAPAAPLPVVATQTPAATSLTPSELQDLKKRLNNVRNNDNRRLMQNVIQGRSFAQLGQRDAGLQKVCSIIAFVLEHPEKADPEKIAEILRPSLDAMQAQSDDPANPALTFEDAVEKLTRALSDATVKRAEKKATEAAEKARLLQKISSPPASGEGAGHAASEFDAGGAGTKTVAPYSDGDLIKFAASQDTTVEEFSKRWLIQFFDSFYVYVDGAYKYPVPRTALLTKLRDDLEPAEPVGVRLWTVSAEGSPRKMNAQEIMDTYGVVARQARGSITLRNSFYDGETEIFWEALCPLRTIVPEYTPEIDLWLRLLGGTEAETLLDWVATVTRLEEQTCALYLSGKAGAGKTLISHGLARLWTEGPPTELTDVVGGSFNAGIGRCPLIFGDEDMTCSTADLRRLIGSSAHTLKRKFLPNMELAGALRLILADNNGHMLEQNEDLGRDDIEAVATKFLRINVGDRPVNYLKSLGGKAGTADWVTGDKIAAHALWLQQNRAVVPGGRFLVNGHAGETTRLLASRSKSAGLVCEWIAGFVETPIVNIQQQKTAILGGGHVLVNVDAISHHWGQYVFSENRALTKTRIGTVLLNLAKGVVKVNGRRYHEIDMDIVFEWCRSIGLGDETVMRAHMDAPLPAGTVLIADTA